MIKLSAAVPDELSLVQATGRVRRVLVMNMLATGPAMPIGGWCRCDRGGDAIDAIVTGFTDDGIVLRAAVAVTWSSR